MNGKSKTDARMHPATQAELGFRPASVCDPGACSVSPSGPDSCDSLFPGIPAWQGGAGQMVW